MPRRNFFNGALEFEGTLELESASAPPTGRAVNDVYLDDGTNTSTGNPGWRYLSSTDPDVWEDTSSGVVDTSAIHKNVPDEYDTAAIKGTPVAGDRLLLEDSEDALNKKYITLDALPGGLSDIHNSVIVVGNSVAGDTSGDCDYLDTGNAAQLSAAIAAAAGSPPKDVWIRPGTYDFRVPGGLFAPISIPDGVKVRGAGIPNVTIIGEDSGDMGIFTLGDNGSLEDVLVQVPQIVAAGNTSRGVIALNGSESLCRGVEVEFLGTWGATEDGYNFLWSAFLGNVDAEDCRLVGCKATVPSISEWTGMLRGVYVLTPTVSGAFWNVVGTRVYGSDIGMECHASANVIENEIRDYKTGGILLGSGCQPTVSRNVIEIETLPSPGPLAGSYGIKCDDVSFGSITDNRILNPNADLNNTYAIWLLNTTNSSISMNRAGSGWKYPIDVNSGANNNKILGNSYPGSGLLRVSIGATGNDIAHNDG